MKKYIPTIIFALIFLTGLSVMLYPFVSDLVNRQSQSKVVSSYSTAVDALTPEDYSAQWEAAQAYNDYIGGFSSISAAVRAEDGNPDSEYNNLLNITGNGVMGIIEIPAINVSMPVYHTTEEAVLQVGAGHYVGSSLPVGGEGTHSIITGHRGLPSAKLFTDLDHLVVGDRFYMKVMGEVLAYEIDRIEVVLPKEMDGLSVTEGKDYLTLVTCTPYGVNSHRMLLRGSRVPYVAETTSDTSVPVISELGTESENNQQLLILAVGGIILLVILMVLIFRRVRRKRTGGGSKS